MVMMVPVLTPLAINHFINGSPVRKAAKVAVVYIDIGYKFGGGYFILEGEASGRGVSVYGIEGEAAVLAESHRIVKQISFTGSPEDNLMTFGGQFPERIYGKGLFLANLWVLVLYNGTVKIYCNNHLSSSFSP